MGVRLAIIDREMANIRRPQSGRIFFPPSAKNAFAVFRMIDKSEGWLERPDGLMLTQMIMDMSTAEYTEFLAMEFGE